MAAATGLLRRHWLFALLMAGGAALRLVTQLAYRPALLVWDSLSYVKSALMLRPHPVRPLGYPLFVRLLSDEGGLGVVAAVQHVLGLAMALAVYVLLVRRNVRPWVAAVATVPALYDALQLNLEHQILSDVLFQGLMVGGIAALLWRPRPSVAQAGLAGLIFAAAALTRTHGLILILPALLTLLAVRAGLRHAAAMVLLFAGPLAGYAMWFHAHHGSYALTASTNLFLYGRAALVADCDRLTLTQAERQLCPVGERLTAEEYVWNKRSPRFSAKAPPGTTLREMQGGFVDAVLREQPLDYGVSIAVDFLRGFAPSRSSLGGPPIKKWQFQTEYPGYPLIDEAIRQRGGTGASASDGPAGFLVAYQRVAVTPGPILMICLLAGFATALGFGRRRDTGLRAAAFLLASVTVGVLASAAAVIFSWRYQLPQLVLLPATGALAVTSFTRAAPEATEPPHRSTYARMRSRAGRLPMPAPVRRFAVEHHIRITKYFVGSVLSGVVSAITFVATFGPGFLGSKGASLTASATGAIAGYFLNRNWTWGRRGRAHFRKEVVPYWTTVVLTAIAAAVVTGTVNAIVRDMTSDRLIRTLINTVAFVGTYGLSFVLKYGLFHRLFGERPSSDEPAADSARAA